MTTATQIDTTPVTREITKLISTGTTEQALLIAIAHLFPDLTRAELSQALQDARPRPKSMQAGGISRCRRD
jgi:ABC-type Fe3+-citrate transport system substrate-binding protein